MNRHKGHLRSLALLLIRPSVTRAFSFVLTAQGIDHVFEEYNGDHRNRLWGRRGRLATEVFPYFWLLLDSQAPRGDSETIHGSPEPT